ncbi:MAG: DNA polymerase III subunit delta [Chloroflexi bacterium]|nr:DNA polymerase III subunit delta [Chloroflexota bacterium]MBL7061615.1 DNA polymerase III subunit delta [Dehalococcoidia bacterium]
MFYILYGKDDFSLQQALEGIKNELGEQEMLAVNTTLLDGQQLSLSQLKDACSTVPFLCSHRLVIVKGLLGRFESKSGSERRATRSRSKLSSGLEELTGLADYVGQMPSTTVLVLIDGEVKANNRLMKSLASQAKVMGFAPLSDRNLSDWIQDRVKQGGGTISPEAMKLLAGLVGADLWTMSSEIDKLLAYCSGQIIIEDSVKQVTSYAREASIFALVDAILEGRRNVAQQLLHRLLQEGASPSYVLAMITRQLRLIVIAKDMGQKLSRPENRDRLEPTSDYGLEKAKKQSKAYTLERIKKAYHKLLEADIAIKTGKYDGDLALDLLVVELGQG